MAQTKQAPTTVYGGNNQFGNNNTQNVYTDVRLTESLRTNMENFINKLCRDSGFHSIKYFKVATYMTSNGAALKADLYHYFKDKGLIDIGNERVIYSTDKIFEGINCQLSKKDSSITVLIGVVG